MVGFCRIYKQKKFSHLEEHIKILLAKYQAGNCTDEEQDRLRQWYEALDNEQHENIPSSIQADFRSYAEQKYAEFQSLMQKKKTRRLRLSPLIRIAASFVILIGVGWGIYLWVVHKPVVENPVLLTKNDIAPGHDGAILTLANGAQIVLDSVGNRAVAQQGNMHVVNDNGQLIYNRPDHLSSLVAYNTLSTPDARQYRLVLSDGTKVWLNAQSALRFNLKSNTKQREVFLSGEAYFEVAKKTNGDGKRIPFVVHLMKNGLANGDIEVLGTHFNVKNYSDDKKLTCTLFEGKIRYKDQSHSVVMKPGEKLIVEDKIKIDTLKNIEKSASWKDGQILLDKENVEEIMNEIGRWYGVEVIYKGTPPKLKLNGLLDRSLPLKDILHVLNSYGLKCLLTGNNIVISQ